MEKEIRHYVEHYWLADVLKKDTFYIDSREGYLIDFFYEGVPRFVGIRFYDIEVTSDKDKVSYSAPFNYSPFIKVAKEINESDSIILDKAFDSIVPFDDYKSEVLGESRIKR